MRETVLESLSEIIRDRAGVRSSRNARNQQRQKAAQARQTKNVRLRARRRDISLIQKAAPSSAVTRKRHSKTCMERHAERRYTVLPSKEHARVLQVAAPNHIPILREQLIASLIAMPLSWNQGPPQTVRQMMRGQEARRMRIKNQIPNLPQAPINPIGILPKRADLYHPDLKMSQTMAPQAMHQNLG